MRKKLLSVALCVAMAATTFVGCGSDDKEKETTKAPSSDDNKETSDNGDASDGDVDAKNGKVYFLNFKPELDKKGQYTALMKKFTEETGIEAKVVTAADNGYEAQLKTEMNKSDAPTLFTINGPVGYSNWKDYCADLKDSEFYNLLKEKDLAITDGDGVYGVPLCIESYGLICNRKIFDAYFAMDGIADTGCKSIEDINSFDKLKSVVEDMQSKKDALGIKGVFSHIALGSGDNWRITNHLFDLPLYYEYMEDGSTDKQEIEFKYNKEYKNILDLYLDNATVDRTKASTGSVDDSMAEFALGEAAIAQNGVWAWGQINVEGGKVAAEDIYYMPIYTGAEGEDKQGLCTGTENFMALNSQASPEDQAASKEFLKWLYTSDAGKEFVSTEYGVAPFEGFDNKAAADANPLIKQALADMESTEKEYVTWVTVTTPSQDWKDNFGNHVLKYAEGTEEWDAVVADAVAKWKSEKEAANEK